MPSFSFIAARVPPSLRLLRRHKRFAALAILSLGVAIALNTTMYSVLDAIISPVLKIRDPERLFHIDFFGDRRGLIPIPERNRAYTEGLTFHEGIAGSRFANDDRFVERGTTAREARVLSVTPNYFAVLGAQASAGRLLSPLDLDQDIRPVVVSERLWRQLFPERGEFSPASIMVGDEPRMIVGLIPYEADFPGANTDVWQFPTREELTGIPLNLARLKPGVTQAQAMVELNTLKLRFAQKTAERDHTVGFRMLRVTGPPFRVGRFHWALIGSVVTVLMIACANLANLQLARGVTRMRELATRAAVGASRRQILLQLLAESTWLAVAGLALAALLTAWGMSLVESFTPPVISNYITRPQLSWRVLAFAVLATLCCLLLVGLIPAIRASRVDVNDLLKAGSGTGRTRAGRRQYGVLVIVEVALALSLLSSASLLMLMAAEVRSFNPDHDSRGLVTSFLVLSTPDSDDHRTMRQWSERVISDALAVPGIDGAATIRSRSPSRRAISLDDPGGAPRVYRTHTWGYSVVSPGYLRTMRIPITRGRDFSEGEFAKPAVIVDEHTARCFWPGADPVGTLIKLDSASTHAPWLPVIGVSGNLSAYFNAIRSRAQPRGCAPPLRPGNIYVLNASDTTRLQMFERRSGSSYIGFLQLLTRGEGDELRHVLQIRRTFEGMAPEVSSLNTQPWSVRTGVAAFRAKQDFVAALFTLFAVVALALAALGVYAVIAHGVAQRTREFGVRIALGATGADIRALVMREGNLHTLLGILCGVLITWKSAGLLRAVLLSEWDRYDARMFALAALLLFAVAWLASWIPARRATRINPVEALRND